MATSRGRSPAVVPKNDCSRAGTGHWLLRHVARICRIANVPTVTSHGLRGTASSLAQSAGMIGDAVAASLGHESFGTTLRHYTDPSVPANAQIARVVDALSPRTEVRPQSSASASTVCDALVSTRLD